MPEKSLAKEFWNIPEKKVLALVVNPMMARVSIESRFKTGFRLMSLGPIAVKVVGLKC